MFGTSTTLEQPTSESNFCTIPRKVRFQKEPHILVRIERTARRHALARAVVELEESLERTPLGEFIILQRNSALLVVGPPLVRLNYWLGKRVEQEILAAFRAWQETQPRSRRYY